MQSVVAMLALCLAAAVHSARPRQEDKYTSQYDNVDVREILASERLFKSYVDCLLDKGPCTPDGKLLKETIPDALQNECSKCTEKQIEGTKIVVPFLIKKKPEVWELLKKKFDPEGKFETLYAHYLEEAEKISV